MTPTRRPVAGTALALAAVASLTGCGPKTELDLDLRAVSITVPRLVTPAVELVPAAPPPPAALPQLPPVVTFLPPVQAPPPAVFTPPSPPPAPACPKAGPLDAPAVPESVTVKAPPVPGTTTQVATGTFATPAGNGLLDAQVDVTITALQSATSSTGQKVDGWKVERRTPSASSVELYQLVHPSNDPLATASGVYLVGMAWKDPARGDLTFQPEGAGLQVLPNPVQLSASGGVQYVGSATDPDTLTTLSLVRNVTGRKRIDVCGELVETFTVEMSGTLTTPDRQRQIAWTQQLAPAYGAANIAETLSLFSQVEAASWTRSLRSIQVPKLPGAGA